MDVRKKSFDAMVCFATPEGREALAKGKPTDIVTATVRLWYTTSAATDADSPAREVWGECFVCKCPSEITSGAGFDAFIDAEVIPRVVIETMLPTDIDVQTCTVAVAEQALTGR